MGLIVVHKWVRDEFITRCGIIPIGRIEVRWRLPRNGFRWCKRCVRYV